MDTANDTIPTRQLPTRQLPTEAIAGVEAAVGGIITTTISKVTKTIIIPNQDNKHTEAGAEEDMDELSKVVATTPPPHK